MKNIVSSKPKVRSCNPRGFTATLKVRGNEAEQQKDGPAVPGAGKGAAGGRLSRLRAQADRGSLPPWLALSGLIFSALLTLCQGKLFGSVSLITLKLCVRASIKLLWVTRLSLANFTVTRFRGKTRSPIFKCSLSCALPLTELSAPGMDTGSSASGWTTNPLLQAAQQQLTPGHAV